MPAWNWCLILHFHHRDEEQWNEDQALVHNHSHPKLLTALAISSHLAPGFDVHPLDDPDGPLLNAKTSHGPPLDFPGNMVKSLLKVNKCEVEGLVGCDELLLKQ